MNKLLGQRKKFNLNISSSGTSSSDDDTKPVVHNKFHISVAVRDDGSLHINNTATSERDTDFNSSYELPKVRCLRSHSQRSNTSQRSTTRSRTPATTRKATSSSYVDETSDDEAFMRNDNNFTSKSPPRPLRRSLRKKKTSSLKRRAGVQTVPEIEPELPPTTATALDDTVDNTGDLSLEWIENQYYSTEAQSSESNGCNVLSEKSFITANAETEDALSEFSDAHGAFKMPFPVSYRPNLAKRKLVVESDEEYISKTFRAPIKRTCIRYCY